MIIDDARKWRPEAADDERYGYEKHTEEPRRAGGHAGGAAGGDRHHRAAHRDVDASTVASAAAGAEPEVQVADARHRINASDLQRRIPRGGLPDRAGISQSQDRSAGMDHAGLQPVGSGPWTQHALAGAGVSHHRRIYPGHLRPYAADHVVGGDQPTDIVLPQRRGAARESHLHFEQVPGGQHAELGQTERPRAR